MLDMLVRWTTVKDSGGVAYQDLVILMDWTHPIPDERFSQIAQFTEDVKPQQPTSDPATPPPLDPPSKLKVSTNYMTSSQAYRATVGELPTHGYKVYGVPTIRTDLPAPRIKRVSDKKVRTRYSTYNASDKGPSKIRTTSIQRTTKMVVPSVCPGLWKFSKLCFVQKCRIMVTSQGRTD